MKKLLQFIFVAFSLNAISQNSCMPFWNNSQTIVLTNPNASILTNYQVKLTINTQSLISATQMNINGNDIRFADGSCTSMPYYIEAGINTATTAIWVKVPSIPASGTVAVTMYFNNPTATAQSNGDMVFEFFDDFSGASLNTTKWSVQGTPSILSLAAGKVTFAGNSNWEYFKTVTTFTSKLTVETNYKMTGVSAAPVIGYGGTDNRFTFRMGNNPNLGTTFDPDVSGGNAFYDMNYPGITSPSGVFNDVKFVSEIITNTINISNFCNVTQSSCNNSLTPLTSTTGTSYFLGFSSYDNAYVVDVDIIKVRKFATSEPTPVIGLTQLNPYIFTNALLKLVFCANETTTVSLVSNGVFNSGNIYSAQISDASGSFTSAVGIGTLSNTTSGSLSLSATIPSTMISGNNYRIRVISSNQSIIGTDNATNFTISPSPLVAAVSNASLICNGQTATLTASGANTFTWNTAATTTVIAVSPTVTTSYTVNGTAANGCKNASTITQSVSACTGINGIESLNTLINIYPNPNNGEFTIVTNSEMNLTLVNNLGQVVKIISVNASNNYKVSISNLANGIYFVFGDNNNQTIKQKIVVAK